MRWTGIFLVVVLPLACGRLGYDDLGTSTQGSGSFGGGNASDAQGGAGSVPDDASSSGGASGAAGGGGAGASGGAGGGAFVDGAAGSGGVAGVDAASGLGGSAGTGGIAGSGGATVDGSAGTDGSAGSDGGGGTILDGGMVPCVFRTYGGHTYAFCDGLVDWTTARAQCEARGMRLVRIDDAAENAWVVSQAVFSNPNFRRHYLWIGGYEPVTDGDWHWTDGEAFWLGDGITGVAVNGLYTNWGNTEPNNANGGEACASIPLNTSTWIDERCFTAEYFACELY